MTDIYMPDQGEMATELDTSSSGTEAFHKLVERLSRQSVDKHFDAYGDIDWDSPEMLIDPGDPRWVLSDMDPLGGTDWYRALHPGTQARIGLYRIASMMKVGAIFESVLKRGLIEFAQTLPDRSPEFRYAYHEMIEEAQHSLMFQEFVNRTGFDIPGLNTPERLGSRVIVQFGHLFPELFFVFVLGGEDPIDFVQRRELAKDRDKHPLLERIVRIHVTEEARHLSFARHFLEDRVPKLPRHRREILTFAAPVILGVMARLMLQPSSDMIHRFQIPDGVVREAYTDNPEHRAETRKSLRKVRELLDGLGLVTPASLPLWEHFRLWEHPPGQIQTPQT